MRPAAAQTALYSSRVDQLVAQLRDEVSLPRVPHGHPAVVLMMGLPGVGKTHVARLVAARIGAAHVASDELRSRLCIAASCTAAENAVVFGCLDRLVVELLGVGHRVVADAMNLQGRSRAATEESARRLSVPLVHLHVTAEDSLVRRHLERRRIAREAGDHSDADERVYERMAARAFEPPPAGYLEVRNGDALDEQIARVVAAVEDACARGS